MQDKSNNDESMWYMWTVEPSSRSVTADVKPLSILHLYSMCCTCCRFLHVPSPLCGSAASPRLPLWACKPKALQRTAIQMWIVAFQAPLPQNCEFLAETDRLSAWQYHCWPGLNTNVFIRCTWTPLWLLVHVSSEYSWNEFPETLHFTIGSLWLKSVALDIPPTCIPTALLQFLALVVFFTVPNLIPCTSRSHPWPMITFSSVGSCYLSQVPKSLYQGS